MSKAEIFNLVLVILFVACNMFLEWTSKHQIKKNQWLDMLNDFANSYVHGYNQTDIDGREKMKNVISAVKAMMEKKGFTVGPEDEKLIEAIAQRAYDKMINDSKKANALDQIAANSNVDEGKIMAEKARDVIKSSLYESNEQFNDEVTDLQADNATRVNREG